jgi:F-type H+-transporting ATPase subunit delta
MQGTKVASRYALSLLDLTEEKKVSDRISQDMESLLSLTKDNHDFAVFLKNPIIKADKKIQILEKVFAHFDELTKGFIRLIAKNGRERYLPVIAASFISQLKAHKGIVPVVLSSAAPLDASVKEDLLGKLQSQVDGKFEVKEEIDKDLIGGFVFKMGDTRIEASIARQLKELKHRLTN